MLTTLDKHFHMVLEWDSNILTKNFSVYSVDGMGHRQKYDIDRHTFLHGHLKGKALMLIACGSPVLIGEEGSTVITAHLPSSGVLTAVIKTPTETYHIEPSNHYITEPHPFHMVAYARSDVRHRLNATQFDYSVPSIHSQYQHGPWNKHPTDSSVPARHASNRRLKRQTGNIGGNTCNMILIADFSAFSMFGGVESAASQMVSVGGWLMLCVMQELHSPSLCMH
jgi:hypothetical protein